MEQFDREPSFLRELPFGSLFREFVRFDDSPREFPSILTPFADEDYLIVTDGIHVGVLVALGDGEEEEPLFKLFEVRPIEM